VTLRLQADNADKAREIMRPIICLTPIKNESWILERFLECASLWADHIIVADQTSSDDSRNIVKRFFKAKLIENRNDQYDESSRQRLLINEARKISSEGILIALDADEILGGNWKKSAAWVAMQNTRRGTILRFPWINLFPGSKKCWSGGIFPFGYVDDGTEHIGKWIHSYRLPFSEEMPSLIMEDLNVLHYQYVDWPRMQSKQRWYQCKEILKNPERSFVSIYRQYHHMNAVSQEHILSSEESWFKQYQEQEVLLPVPKYQTYYWWDAEIVDMFIKHGVKKFRRLSIWDVHWPSIYTQITGNNVPLAKFEDPRTLLEKSIHKYLRLTQSRAKKPSVQRLDQILTRRGW
jgi:hypothetical protein